STTRTATATSSTHEGSDRACGSSRWARHAPSASASTSTSRCPTTSPRPGSRRRSLLAAGSSPTSSPGRGGCSPTPTATRPASAPGRTATRNLGSARLAFGGLDAVAQEDGPGHGADPTYARRQPAGDLGHLVGDVGHHLATLEAHARSDDGRAGAHHV